MERAIQAVYTLEEDELASERLGQGRYLLFWEAAEGGAGVLSQILENPKAFQKLADEALDISHFHHEKESCTQACYECLLSYRNQFDHPLLNRHYIRAYLEDLHTVTIYRAAQGVSYEEHYQQLRAQTNLASELERKFLDELYKQGIKLPDTAQELIPDVNVKPDFLYRDKKVAIFCDGSVHDTPEQKEQDRIQRDNLKFVAGYRVLCFIYDEDWTSKLSVLASL
ncbi:Zn-binding domain-containing protein [Leptolyngbya sp. AN02str]|uniref:Zn-binding domain-containing protein n=1 Tax=Leptolyngbya sp. AN02str TaxID=3423363 RepID=UPI003D31BD1A